MIGAITGILASRNAANYEYFTSALYPILVADDMAISTPVLQSGTLSTIVIIYNEPLAEETATISVPTLQSGELSIIVVTYNEPLAEETATISVPTLQSGTLL